MCRLVSEDAAVYVNNDLNQLTNINASAVATSSRGDIAALPGAPAYGYDAAGRLIAAGSTDYAFDPAGRLYETDGATGVRFQYDGLQLATEYDFSNVAIARHIPGAGLDEILVTYSGGGLTTRTYPIADERGSVIALTNASAIAVQINTYDEYGVPAGGNAGRFQYTGQQWLPDAGLYHYRARAYAASVGRFTGPDPIGYAAGANLYGYVAGDPVNRIDPLGLTGRHISQGYCYSRGGEIVPNPARNNGDDDHDFCVAITRGVGRGNRAGGAGYTGVDIYADSGEFIQSLTDSICQALASTGGRSWTNFLIGLGFKQNVANFLYMASFKAL